MKKINLVFVIAFALMFTLGGLNNVFADVSTCFAEELGSPLSFTDTAGKINGYSLGHSMADNETAIYIWAYKNTSDQIIYKFDPSTMNILQSYDITETAIGSNYFGLRGITLSNEGGSPVIYGYYGASIYKYDLTSGVTSVKFADYPFLYVNDIGDITINKDGESTDAPTELIGSTHGQGTTKVVGCTWENSPTCTLKKTFSKLIPEASVEPGSIDFQEDDLLQEIVVSRTTRFVDGSVRLHSLDYPSYNQVVFKSYGTYTPSSHYVFTSGLAHLSSSGKVIYIHNSPTSSARFRRTYTGCSTATSGLVVSTDEFDNANQAKALADGTTYAVFDDSALLGWYAFSFIDTVDAFNGVYSTDATNWVNIAGLQTYANADEGYLVADFGEQFDTTTYKDAGNTTADWDTVNEWVVLDSSEVNGLAETWTAYDTAVWEDPQPAFATIASEKLNLSSISPADNHILSNDTFLYKTLEFNAKLISTIGDTGTSAIGFRNFVSGGYVMFTIANGNDLGAYNNDGSTTKATTFDLSFDYTSYHDFKIIWTDSSIGYYVDDVLKVTHTENIPTGALPVFVRNKSDTGHTTISYVDSMSIAFDLEYDAHDEMQTLTIDSTASTITDFNIKVDDTQPANTDITYDVSCNGGSNWATGVTAETSTECDTTGSDLRVKATLETTDTAVTPTINNFAMNYTTDGTDATTPAFFTTDYYSYLWDTTSLSNDQYYFKMTAEDDGANSDYSVSQEFTVCHGDTLQLFQDPDYTTDLYVSTACTNTVELTENNTDTIIIKVVNQDAVNTQSFTLDVNNTTNDYRFYDIYNSTDGVTWNSQPDTTLTRKVIKQWSTDSATFTHSFTNELSASETEYYKLVYRLPYAIVTADLPGYESTLADATTADIWVVTQGDIRFNDLSCTDLDGGDHCLTLAGQSEYSVGAFETSDTLDMTLGNDNAAFSIGFIARYEIIFPGVPELHVQTRTSPELAWSDVFVSRNGGTGDNDGIPMTTSFDRYTATISADSYVKIYIDEPASGVSDVHFSEIFVMPDNFFTGEPLFKKSDGSDLDLLPSLSNTEDSYRYLNEADPFKIQVSYYDKDALIDLVKVTVMKFPGNDIVKIVNVAVTPSIENVYSGVVDLEGFIDTSDTVSQIYAQVDLYDADTAEVYKTSEEVQFHQFPYYSTDYKAGIVFNSDSKFIGKAPTGQINVQMTTTNPLTKLRLKIWDVSSGTAFSEATPNHVELFLKGTDFVCNYGTCDFTFDLSNSWVWSNEAQFLIKLEPYFSTTATQPYSNSAVFTSVNISSGSMMNAVLMFADNAMESTERLFDLTSLETRDATLISSSETKRFLMKVKSGDGVDLKDKINVYLTLFKYGPNTEMVPTKRDTVDPTEENISGNTTEATCQAVATQSPCNATVGCYWFKAPVTGCSSIGDPVPYYKQEYSALNGINYYYFETPLLEDDGSYMDDASHYGLLGFVDDTTGTYGDRVVALSRFIPYDSWLPYSANPQRYVAADDETTCFDQSGIQSAVNCEIDPHCADDDVDETYGKFRCTRSTVGDQFCDLEESCETPLRVSTTLSVTRPTITNIICIPYTGTRANMYNSACTFTFKDSGSPITGVDILLWNENTDWTQTTNVNKQWIQFSVPYEKLRELDTNATYLNDYAEIFAEDPTITKTEGIWDAIWSVIDDTIYSLFSSASLEDRIRCVGSSSLSARECLELADGTASYITESKMSFMINSVGFVNTKDYAQLTSIYESGYTTEEQCFNLDYAWNPDTSQCFSSVDPKRALEYAAQEDITLTRSTWNASTVFNGKVQDTYSGSSPMVVDFLAASDLNATINAPINATVRIWWEQGGEMMSEQLTVNDAVLLKYTTPGSCGNWTTYSGWGEKFSCYSLDITNFIKGNFFFMLVLLMVLAVIFGGMKAARRG